jgi:hypothetical protein
MNQTISRRDPDSLNLVEVKAFRDDFLKRLEEDRAIPFLLKPGTPSLDRALVENMNTRILPETIGCKGSQGFLLLSAYFKGPFDHLYNDDHLLRLGLLEMATPLYSLIVSASFLSRMQGFPRVPIIASLSQRPSIQTGCVRIRTGVETGSISYGTRFHRATF